MLDYFECPECGNEIEVEDGDSIGDELECGECGEISEIVSLYPPELGFSYGYDDEYEDEYEDEEDY